MVVPAQGRVDTVFSPAETLTASLRPDSYSVVYSWKYSCSPLRMD